MNATFQDQHVAGAIALGMLACGLCLPDDTFSSYSFHELYPQEHLDHILHQLAQTMKLLAGFGMAPQKLVWTFEQGQIFAIPRPDGALLVLITQPNADTAQTAEQLAKELFPVRQPAEPSRI